MRFIRNKKVGAAVAAGALVIVGAGAAFAFWTQGGTGTGSGSTGTTTGITVNQTSLVTGMYPGSTPQALSGNFDNPNANAVTVASVTAAVTSVTGGGTDGTKPACTTADYVIGGSAAGSVVPAGTAQGGWSGLTLQLVNGALNQDNCKNAVAHITYTAN
jgi:hypothetical protein